MDKALAEALRAFLHDGPAPEAMALADLANQWLVVDHLIRLLEHRKAELRGFLLDRARADGESTDKGGSKLRILDATIQRKVMGGESYPVAATKALLAQKDLPALPVALLATRVKEELVVNPDAIRYLEQRGFLTPAEIASIRRPPTETLEVLPDEDTQAQIEGLYPLLPGMARKGSWAGT